MLELSLPDPLDYSVASLFFLGVMYAAYSRDLGLITGSCPTSSRRSEFLGHLTFTLPLVRLLMASMFESRVSWILGRLLTSLFALVIALESGPLGFTVRGGKTIAPGHLAREAVKRVSTVILWVLLAGPIAVMGSVGSIAEAVMLRDALIP